MATKLDRVYLSRVYLDKAGYDYFGSYWGHYQYLYRLFGDSVETYYFRARDRPTAKSKVRVMYPEATFYR